MMTSVPNIKVRWPVMLMRITAYTKIKPDVKDTTAGVRVGFTTYSSGESEMSYYAIFFFSS